MGQNNGLSMECVYGILVVFLCCSCFIGVNACRNCTQNDFMTVQEACKESNEILDRAQKERTDSNKSSLCSYLFDFYFCVGDHVPACLAKITEGYARFYESPYDCHPPPNVTLKLQNYNIKAQDCSMKPITDTETTVEYSIITSTLDPSHAERQNVNSTNSAISKDVKAGTFLIVFSSVLSWYLDSL